MATPTVTRLCDQLAIATGIPAADLKMRARALRQGGILPASARGAGATPASTREGIAMLLAAMGQGQQSDAARTVNRIWSLGFTGRITQTSVGTDGTGAITRRHQEITADQATIDRLKALDLGGVVGLTIDQCRSAVGRAGVLNTFRGLHVWQDGSSAMVEMLDGKQLWWGPVADPNAPASMIKTAPISFMSTVPATVLAVLADATMRPSDIRADEPELDFNATTETKDAPQHEANGASESMMFQRPGKAEVPDTQSDSRTERESGAMGFGASPNVTALHHGMRNKPPHGKVEPVRAARRP